MRIDTILSNFNKTRPKEIHRKVRSLIHIKFWKGTEFRTFLLYLGVAVLKYFLPNDEYLLYLRLHIAVSICSSQRYAPYLPKAREQFNKFIEDYIDIYGIDSITSNVHNLTHVVDDVEKFGPLSNFSSYEFEKKLHHIQLLLEQVARRLG